MASPTETPTVEKRADEAAETEGQQPDPEQSKPEADQDPPPEAVQPEPEQVVEAADAVDMTGVGVVRYESPAGSLTLRPNQRELDEDQRWALKAINIDVDADKGIIPHLRAFVHMCQIRGLDMFAREAYLIGRGTGKNRVYTMQTGIDGYRKMAASTGRLIRVKSTLWTGLDDDDRSYRLVEEDGDYVQKRVWFDQWPATRGNPGAAKVTVEHYDDAGNVVTTSAVADWAMYAASKDVWEGPQGNRRKVMKDGKVVQELNEMWAKGGPHMLAKCAEALAYRKAFPARLNGFYVNEEMSRLDEDERERQRQVEAARRREAYAAAQRPQKSAEVAQGAQDEPQEPAAATEPTPVGETAQEVVRAAQSSGSEEDRLAWLRAELDFQAEVLGHPARNLAQRRMKATRKDLDAFAVEDMLGLVSGLRLMTVEALNAAERHDEATAYGGLGPTDIVDVHALLAIDGEIVEDGPSPEDDPRLDANPEEPHEYVDDGGTCAVCGRFSDEKPHPGAEAAEAD